MKLKVLILSKSLSAEGGIANLVRILIKNLSKDIESEHFPTGSGNRFTGKLMGSILLIRDSFRLAIKVKKNKYDCVHINSSLNARSLLRDSLFLLVLFFLRFRNTIVFFHGWDERIQFFLMKNRISRFLFRKAFGHVPLILVLSPRFKETLVDIGIPPQKITYITTFFDGDIFKGIQRRDELNEKRLLFLSRLIKEKGVFETIEAFKSITLEFPSAILILAGDGPETIIIKEKIKEYGIEDRVRFLGYVRGTSKGQAFLDSDIFILPSYGEGCPVALLEAMAAGLPVITCPVGGIPDIFIEGKNGIFLSNPSPEEIADAICRLLQDDSMCINISKNNKQYAWRNFEARLVTGKIEQLYTKTVMQNLEV
jgi:glycosyltransferase involved in cell wall biosynthesis